MSTKGGFRWTPRKPDNGRRSVEIANSDHIAHLSPDHWEDFGRALIALGGEFGIKFVMTGGPKPVGKSGTKKKATNQKAPSRRTAGTAARKKAAKK